MLLGPSLSVTPSVCCGHVCEAAAEAGGGEVAAAAAVRRGAETRMRPAAPSRSSTPSGCRGRGRGAWVSVAGAPSPPSGRANHGGDGVTRGSAASRISEHGAARVIGMIVIGLVLTLIMSSLTRATSSTTPQPIVVKSSSCPDACVCESEPLPETVESRRRPGKMLSCTGTPVNEVGSATTEILRVRNVTVRRLDFWSLHRMPALLVLDLANAGIIELSGSGKTVPLLRSLDLSGNTIHVLQAHSLRDFPELRMLNLSSNGLHSLELSALRLRMLHVLDLRHNKLTSLKYHFFSDLPMLQDLLLSENALSVVPSFVFPSNLRVLDLSKNKLVRFEEGAFDGVNISVLLDLSHNSLRRVPNSALKRLAGIGSLILDGNPLQSLVTGSVTGVLAQSISIQHVPALDLVHRDAFVNLPELQTLSLAYNPDLSYVHPESFNNAPHLHTLDLSGTSLFTLERSLFDAVPSLQTICLDGDTLHCGCGLAWLHNLTEGAFTCRDNTTTSEPDVPCAPFIIPLFASDYWETLGNNASFQCRAVGYPDIKVTWFSKDHDRLFNNECVGRVCVADNTLTVHYLHAGDAGRYTCVATNEVGSDSREVLLHVRDVHVRLFPLTVTSTFVTLAWNMSSAVTNNYMLRVEEAECPENVKSVVFSVGLKMHSYTVHGLKPGTRYTFTLAIQREEYTLVIGSTDVTMREGDFLVTLGIERSYLSVILLSALAGVFLAGCLSFCGLKCWKQRLRLQQAAAMRKSDSAFSGRDMLSTSCSAESDLGVGLATPRITYISLADERRPLSNLSAVSPSPLPAGTPLVEACCVWDENLMGVT